MLIGHLQAAYLEPLQAHIEGHGPRIVLDLDAVTLVEVEVVRFLGVCEAAGIALLHGSPLYASGLPRSNIGQEKVAWSFTIARVRQARRFG
jgi:hypothetical protein